MEKYYLRQVTYTGLELQETLKNTRVAVVGVGGLGGPLAIELARLGVGTIHLIDGDVVQESNLARQTPYSPDEIGQAKVEVLAKSLTKANPNINIQAHHKFIQEKKDLEELNIDFIFDGLDTHAIRRIINQFCQKKNIPWVHGAAIQETGTVAFFFEEFNYESIYKNHKKDTHCADTGVLITTTTLVASLQVQLFLNYLRTKKVESCFYRVDAKNLSIDKILV